MAVRRALPLVGYLLLMVGVIGAFAVNARQRTESRRSLCEAILDDRRTLADVIALAVPPVRPVDANLSPELQHLIAESQHRTQAFLDRAQRRLARDIAICADTGVETGVTVHGATPLPVQVTTTPGTTTTTRPALRGSSTATTRSRGTRTTHTIAPRPAPGPGPTTTRPTSPTTRPCRVRVPTDGCAL